MRIQVGDLWDREGDWRVIPVNLSLNAAGHAIMGRGTARQAADKYPHLARQYGEYLKARTPEQPYVMWEDTSKTILVPVKTYWKEKADLALIQQNLIELKQEADWRNQGPLGVTYNNPVFLPLLGCGYGELDPLTVLTLMARILDYTRFVLVLKDASVVSRYPQSFKPGIRTDRTA